MMQLSTYLESHSQLKQIQQTSIREVITFPKTQTAFDPLFETPSLISDQQLRELNFNIHNQK